MNIATRTLHTLCALALVTSATSSSWAGLCTSDRRSFVNQDSLIVSCKSATGVTCTGQGSVNVSGSVRTIFASYTAGPGVTSNITVRAFDASGSTMCQVTDNNVGGVIPSDGSCTAAAVTWQVFLNYNN